MSSALDARRLLLAALLIAAAAGSWWLARRADEPPTPPAPVASGQPDYIIEDFLATVMNERGTPRYRLQAVRLVHFPDDGRSELERPYLIQYGEGAPVHTRAARGRLPADRRVIDLSGDVRSARGRDPKQFGGEMNAERMRIVLDK